MRFHKYYIWHVHVKILNQSKYLAAAKMLPLAAPMVESTTRSAIVIGITLCPTTSITWFLFQMMCELLCF